VNIDAKKSSIIYWQNKFNSISKKIIHHNQVSFIPGMQGWFNIYKSLNVMIIWQAYSQHHTKWRETETVFSKARNKTRESTHCTLVQHSFEISSQGNKAGRRNYRNINRKEIVKLSLFADDVFLENSTKKFLDTINSFGKVVGYQINLQKSVVQK
jgi:hypothetical protein